MKMLCWILAWIMLTVPVGSALAQDLDLTIPDALAGTQIAEASAGSQGLLGTVTQGELDQRLEQERDKTNDTIAIAVWAVIGLLAVGNTHWGKKVTNKHYFIDIEIDCPEGSGGK